MVAWWQGLRNSSWDGGENVVAKVIYTRSLLAEQTTPVSLLLEDKHAPVRGSAGRPPHCRPPPPPSSPPNLVAVELERYY